MPWKYTRIEIPVTDREQVEALPPPWDATESQAEALKPKRQTDQEADVLEKPAHPDDIRPIEEDPSGEQLSVELQGSRSLRSFPWASVGTLLLGLVAASSLEPGPGRTWLPGVVLFALSFTALGYAIYRGEWRPAPIPHSVPHSENPDIRLPELAAGLVIMILIFVTSGGNRLTVFNLTLLSVSVILTMRAFWIPAKTVRQWFLDATTWLRRKHWTFTLTPETLLLAGAVLLILVTRFTGLDGTPGEMNSDHAEKILDVLRVLGGQTMIFFPTNGGREALQMYLVAGLHRFLGLDVDFLALKLASSIVGFISLIFIYKLGKLVANARVGLLAFTFAGIAYWTNVVSRMGLRLPFVFLFTAATMFFLIRGLKEQNRNDFPLAGLSLGLGFYGYTADRILPLLVVIMIAIFLLNKESEGYRRSTLTASIGLVLVAVVLFIPLFRFMVDYPEAFLFRSLSRMGGIEQPLSEPAPLVFLQNLGKALVMFSWSNGQVWTLSVPYRPALDIATSALYWIGLVLLLVRVVRKRHWLDIALLLSIPILLLPSVLALAFPAENPNLYRAGGAAIPVFLVIALALDGFMSVWETRWEGARGKLIGWAVAILLVFASFSQGYDLVFRQYHDQYLLSAWNSSEMGEVIRSFSETIGSPDTAWVVGYPHWVDTRIVAMRAGRPLDDVNITIDQVVNTQGDSRPKLFLVKPEDEMAAVTLNNLYPQGTFTTFSSKVPSKEFLIFLVPGNLSSPAQSPATAPP